ncbi:hypothetical protein [Kineococcus terrestris]|uniref:hypothetical protein n=1 Tax=Kineococcus terrestris TaxID=2044856 RepID=UPI0034DB4572
MGRTARLQRGDVACWVLKTRTDPVELLGGARAGTLERCLHRTYRADLVRAGDACLLWASGASAGVRAVGEVVTAADAGLRVRVAVRVLEEPVPRALLLADPALARAEVVRVPVGGNPSYLDHRQLAALAAHLDVEVGWPGGAERATGIEPA